MFQQIRRFLLKVWRNKLLYQSHCTLKSSSPSSQDSFESTIFNQPTTFSSALRHFLARGTRHMVQVNNVDESAGLVSRHLSAGINSMWVTSSIVDDRQTQRRVEKIDAHQNYQLGMHMWFRLVTEHCATKMTHPALFQIVCWHKFTCESVRWVRIHNKSVMCGYCSFTVVDGIRNTNTSTSPTVQQQYLHKYTTWKILEFFTIWDRMHHFNYGVVWDRMHHKNYFNYSLVVRN